MRTTLLALAAACCLFAPATAAEAGSLRLGFTDREVFQNSGADDRAAGLQQVRAARSSLVRISTGWREIARTRPPSSAAARDPGWPGYNWTSLDPVVLDVVAEGLVPLLSFTAAPDWAEGPNRPAESYRAQLGTWRPSPSLYRDFAEAVARRYSGGYAGLPAVRYLQAWNEPNLVRYLSPQWQRRRGRLVAASPSHYRRLLNGFYAGVKAGNPRARVLTAGTAPFGDPVSGGFRIPPARFVRDWLCVRGRARPRPVRCPGGPARFDILAHHPYSTGPPARKAFNQDDITIRDLSKLTRPLRAAIRGRKVFPRRQKQLWITELSWDSRPPDPDGVPAGRHARWVSGAFYFAWRQGVDAITWFHLRDELRGQGYPFTYQSGIFTRGPTIEQDAPKPAYRVFRFPFTAYRSRGVARLWGIAPNRGRVTIQVRRNGGWQTLTSARARSGRIFSRRRPIARGSVLRAKQGGEVSLSWRAG